MNKNRSRRELMKMVCASTAIGFAGNVSASGTDSSTGKSSNESYTFPYDVSVRDNTHHSATLSVKMYKSDANGKKHSQNPEFSRTYKVDGRGSRSSSNQHSLDIPGGIYLVEAELDSGATADALWGIPSGGVPDWKSISFRIMPDDIVSITTHEI